MTGNTDFARPAGNPAAPSCSAKPPDQLRHGCTLQALTHTTFARSPRPIQSAWPPAIMASVAGRQGRCAERPGDTIRRQKPGKRHDRLAKLFGSLLPRPQ